MCTYEVARLSYHCVLEIAWRSLSASLTFKSNAKRA